VIAHEDKPYNFDFDFFNDDRLVCTEVIYRAFDGLEGLEFPLTHNSGRQTLSDEVILHYAHCSQRFSTLAHYSTAPQWVGPPQSPEIPAVTGSKPALTDPKSTDLDSKTAV
jgi:hypothetical protein